MGIFDDLKQSSDVEQDKDVIGGGSKILESDLYQFTIDMMYMDVSSSGAKSINISCVNGEGQQFKETIYVTSGTAKGGKNFFIDKRSGKKRYLPGFAVANSISQVSLGKDLGDLDFQEKTIKIWDSTVRKEIPQKRQVAMDMLGKQVALGILKVEENKSMKDADGNYQPINDKRTFNTIDKVFDGESLATLVEKTANETPVFHTKWLEKNKGRTVNKFKEVKEEGVAVPTGGKTVNTASMFDD